MKCCLSCGYEGTGAGVRAHLFKSHAATMAEIKRFSLGRPRRDACETCGLVHDDISRPGWALNRRFLERPRASFFHGRLPGIKPDEWVTLGRTEPVDRERRIKQIRFTGKLPKRFRLLVHNAETGEIKGEYLFEIEAPKS